MSRSAVILRAAFRLLLCTAAAWVALLSGSAAEPMAPTSPLAKLLDDAKAAVTGPAASGALDPAWLQKFTWRPIGPAAMGGRITALTIYEADPSIYWVATASGGLLKTVNNGVTFEHQFDREATVSIGDVCVAPSNKDIVWLGTGEGNPRNSVSYGDGVYKSTDGGKSWKNMGLRGTFQTGRIVVHPRNPDIVYVGALGRLYGSNEERGLFKTTDGGKTWNKILYVDDRSGVIDVQMNPADPETLLVAAWERMRDGFDSHRGEPPVADGYDPYDPIKKYGPGSLLFKTTDGGKNWKQITKGLPTCNLGRIGLDFYRKDPNVVYMVLDSEKLGMGPPLEAGAYMGILGEDAPGGARLKQVSDKSPASKAGLQPGDVVVGIDEEVIADFKKVTELLAS